MESNVVIGEGNRGISEAVARDVWAAFKLPVDEFVDLSMVSGCGRYGD